MATMTKQVKVLWSNLDWVTPALYTERGMAKEGFIAAGKSLPETRIVNTDLDNNPDTPGDVLSESYWVDQSAAEEWQAWTISFAVRHSLPLVSVTVEDIPADWALPVPPPETVV